MEMDPHPELLPILLFCENLLPNEFIRVSSILPLPASPSGNLITDSQGQGRKSWDTFENYVTFFKLGKLQYSHNEKL